jgi:hypothetical protein
LGYFTSKRRIIGESPSGATEDVAIKMAPVARVGIMAGNACRLKKRNSSANMANGLFPVPLKLYLILSSGCCLM